MRFQTLIQDTLAELAFLPCQAILLPEPFARITRNEVEGVLVMETQFISVDDLGELRIVHIYAPKINVLTLFFFPHPAWQLPVYCLELVVFGSQPIVGLLDTVCLLPMACTGNVRQFMMDAHTAHPHLQQANDTPNWFRECRSGQDFFLRPQTDEELSCLAEIHLALLASPLKTLFLNAKTFNAADTVEHQRHLQAYKHHHQLNAPGLRLMNRSFGDVWTTDYMNLLFR
jgi:hypothetical protein